MKKILACSLGFGFFSLYTTTYACDSAWQYQSYKEILLEDYYQFNETGIEAYEQGGLSKVQMVATYILPHAKKVLRSSRRCYTEMLAVNSSNKWFSYDKDTSKVRAIIASAEDLERAGVAFLDASANQTSNVLDFLGKDDIELTDFAALIIKGIAVSNTADYLWRDVVDTGEELVEHIIRIHD